MKKKTLLSYHGKVGIKRKYLKRVRTHAQADELIKGNYWSNGKGCAVGCTVHSGNHGAYEIDLGIPKWLAHVEDTIFEGLENGESKKWPERFLKAIPIGINLEKKKGLILIEILNFAKKQFDNDEFSDVTKAIDRVVKLYKDGGTPRQFEDAAADAAARAAADAAVRAAADAYKYMANKILVILKL